MTFLVFFAIFAVAMVIWAGGPTVIVGFGPHFFALAILGCAALAIYGEWLRGRLTILSFPLAGSFLFIWGLFGPYYQLEVVGEYVFYNHLKEYLIPQAMAFALICFALMWMGYFMPKLSGTVSYNPVIYLPKGQDFTLIAFWAIALLWVILSLIHVGGISGLLYKDQPRAYDQFFLTGIRRNIGLAIRFLAVILGFTSVVLFLDRKTGKMAAASWFVLVFWFMIALSQYDRGKFLEVAIVILGAYFMTLRRFKLRQLFTLTVVSLMCVAIWINANGRLYGKTGLLTIPEAVSFGVEHKVKDPYSIFPEVGSLVMTTTAVELYNEGIKRPVGDVFYQINPLPSFLLPAALRPDFFIERLLGAFGSSGVPMPLMAFGYMSFGVVGCVFFGLLGLYFRTLSARIRYVRSKMPGLPAVIGIFIYPVSLAGTMYTFVHGEPRGSIRMVLYAFIILVLLRMIFPGRFPRLSSVEDRPELNTKA